MGQLTNLYVSQSYQGLIKLANSTTGVTGTLQYTQDGVGNNLPIQISTSSVNITGSFTVNGLPVGTPDTGSLVTTASFNAYTSSNDSKVNSLIAATSSYVTETETGSFITNVASSLLGNNIIEIQKADGSYLNSITIDNVQSSSFASNSTSASFAQNALSASYAPDSSNRNGLITTGSAGGSQSITGSLNIGGTITATSASFTYVNTVYETASVIYSTGSNILGDASNDTQTLNGTVNIPLGNLYVTGTTYNIYGNLIGTSSFAETASYFNGTVASASYATNADTASIARDVIVVGKCNNGGGLTRGTVVRIVGANGDNPLFDSASWTDETNSANVLGMLSEDVAFNGFANVVVLGKVLGLNTNAYTPSTNLYLSSSGQFTSTVPTAPSQSVRLGQVLRQNVNNGSIYFRADNGYELDELHNVLISSPQQGNILSYVSGSYGLWENKTSSQLGLATSSSVNLATGSLLKTGSVAGNVLTFTKGDGTTFNLTVATGSGSSNRDGLITTGSIAGTQSITGSLISSGSSQFVGTHSITGSVNITNALAPGTINLQVESGSFTKTAINLNAEKSFIQGAGDLYFFNTWDAASSGSIYFQSPNQINFLATSSVNISGSNNVDIKSSKITATGSVNITTGPLNVINTTGTRNVFSGPANITQFQGKVEVTGSLEVTSSLYVGRLSTLADTNISGALITNTLNDGMIYINSEAYNSSSFKASITASAAISQSNIIFGSSTGPGTVNSTGSIVVSGSNNIMLLGTRQSTIGQGTYGFINGIANVVGNFPTLTTSSVLRPTISNNNIQNGLSLAFTTSSLGTPSISSNYILGPIAINHQSGSITYANNINLSTVTSTANNIALPFLTTLQQNYFGGSSITLSHISSSITATNNILGGAAFTVTNLVSSSISATANGLSFNNNLIMGQAGGVWVSGSNSTNRRNIVSNIIGGVQTAVSSSQVGTEAHLVGSIIYGQNLIVSASHTNTAVGGTAFFGRYNDATTLHTSQEVVFAVGTGTGTSARRTGLYVTSGSLVGVSGSLQVIGATSITGALNVSSSAAIGMDIQTFSTNHTGALFISSSGLVALDVKGYNTNLSSSLNLTGSLVQTGSLQQNVVTLTNSSNTASLDLSQGNFFSYVLADSSANYLNPINVKPGMRFTVKAIGTGASSQIEINSAKFAGGPGLVAVGTSGSYRIFDFISYDNSKPAYLQQYGLF